MSAEKPESKPFHIIVNARPREVTGEAITYKQVVLLAFPNAEFAQFNFEVQYTAPHVPDGSLVDGQSVPLANGLKFDVTRTNKS
jgi:Multiubiquitin